VARSAGIARDKSRFGRPNARFDSRKGRTYDAATSRYADAIGAAK